ncbi:ATP-binding protein [Candidatus Cloacimonadota bacterium]
MSLHLLDIIENSVRAEATVIDIIIKAEILKNRLEISIKDNGTGMDSETVEKTQDPFYTTKEERVKKVGLGIPLFKHNAEITGGSLVIDSLPGNGTGLHATFQFDHVDRIPLGNIADTMITAIVGHPEVDFNLNLIRRTVRGEELDYTLSTLLIKEELGDIPLTYPDVIQFLENDIKEGIINTKMEEF